MKKHKSKKPGEEGFSIRVKVWIEDEKGELVMGMGRVSMFDAIERTGSLNKAAAELNMSYRSLWGRLKKTEERLGREVIVRATGGKDGGGSELTPRTREMAEQFRKLHDELDIRAEELFGRFMREFLEKGEE